MMTDMHALTQLVNHAKQFLDLNIFSELQTKDKIIASQLDASAYQSSCIVPVCLSKLIYVASGKSLVTL